MLFTIAWRNLWRHRTRSLVIIASVTLGVWAGSFIVALYYGMGNERVRIAIEEEVSHLQIHHPEFKAEQEAVWNFALDSVDAVLRRAPDVRAWSLRTTAMGMLATAGGSNGVQINGVDPPAEVATRRLDRFVVTGAWFDTAAKHQVLIGKKLADKMKLAPGGRIVLTFLDREQNIASAAFRVRGIYETSNAPRDERHVYVVRDELNELLGLHGRGTEAAVLLTGTEAVTPATAALQKQLPALLVETWMSISPETALIMAALDSSSVIIIAIILLALAFGIVNTMLMAVLERTREIGMLMAIGMTRARVFAMIVLETVLLTLAGCPLGFALAALVNWRLSVIGIDLGRIAGNVVKDFGYGAVIYPDLPGDKVWQIIQIVCITALLASVFPAWKALKLRPVAAINR